MWQRIQHSFNFKEKKKAIGERNETDHLQAGEQMGEQIQGPPEKASQSPTERENSGHVEYKSNSQTVDQDTSVASKFPAELYCQGNIFS